MGHTLYSHTLRILTCGKCGAPVEAPAAGGSVTCGYCQAASRFARRDESADLSAAQAGAAASISESERFARLRQQDLQPAPLPPAVAALLVDGHLPRERVPEAEAAWRDTRGQMDVTPSFPVCERFFHLTVMLTPHFEERHRRAALETAVELLPDAGHRHVLRCMLAREAARAGDFAAAEAWLAPVNPRPTDLAEDTAYRLAKATLASARRAYREVVEVLGFTREDVPLENRSEVACWILRLDALEHLGRQKDAIGELGALVDQWGLDRVRYAIEAHRPLHLCVGALRAVEQRAAESARRAAREATARRVTELERRIADLDPPLGQLFRQLLVGTAFITFLFGAAWTCVLSMIIETDPLFGLHARAVCPRVCDHCRGPYHFQSWSSTVNGSTTSHIEVYCSDRAGQVTRLAEQPGGLFSAATSNDAWLAQYQVPGGVWLIGVTVQLFFAPFALVVVFALKLRGWLARRAAREPLAHELAAARDALARA
ncbi:MAG: hypothetical protein KF729_05990 [Sandaracinaceae bacterium]|nr:hypothetical protein [Sandaracinaceae bacterium]